MITSRVKMASVKKGGVPQFQMMDAADADAGSTSLMVPHSERRDIE